MDMCHGTIGSDLIEIQSQDDQNYGTPKIPEGFLIGNRWFDYSYK